MSTFIPQIAAHEYDENGSIRRTSPKYFRPSGIRQQADTKGEGDSVACNQPEPLLFIVDEI